ncbi:hypothetical protein [Marinobacter sp. DY40_1A1]|uniref:hypothetical protein n=1 Tax=Marinobacter sp. DY40_1A1 TaxID=2583229 RepID=UPI0019040D97|nr:hypothetical protein [Marinobacter sp. DY40_1A1]
MTESVLNAASSSENPIVFDLAPFLNYPIQLIVQSWHSQRPLSWQSQNNEGVVDDVVRVCPPLRGRFRYVEELANVVWNITA